MQGKYYVVTYGCQMNVHESEKIAGLLRSVGYESAASQEEADVIVFNTCCIRENAENHAFGNIGALKKLKKQKKGLIIAVGGCMTQEKGKADVLKEKFPFIDIIFGTLNLEELPALIEQKKRAKKRVVKIREKEGEIVENVQPFRTSFPNAWVNIAYGCDNFCSYCIVPYVRGRERSRKAENILAEVKSLVEQGYKEITLLGQNVNSYGNDLADGTTFASLLDRAASIEGKFRLRFMTNHPKDFNADVIAVMKKHPKICRLVHLPVQSGSDEILRRMNRRYTSEKYLERNPSFKNGNSRSGSHHGYYRRLPGGNGRRLFKNGRTRKKGGFRFGVYVCLFKAFGHAGGRNARSDSRRSVERPHHAACGARQFSYAAKIGKIRGETYGNSVRRLRRKEKNVSRQRRIRAYGVFSLSRKHHR